MRWHYRDPGPEFILERHFPEQHQEVISNLRLVEQTIVPIATGTLAVAIPYIAGASLVYFGPTPYHKALGASMLVPGPQDAAYFAAGYYVGSQLVENYSFFDDDVHSWGSY